MKRYGIERRQFMQYMAAVSAIPTFATAVDGYVEKNPVFKKNPFTLSVASGDPEPNGVVIWTRLSESPLIGEVTLNTAIEVEWEIAHDEGFKSIANKGIALAVPQLGHSVHVEVEGLEPDRWYFYRFHAGSETSPTGRTRTTPEKHVLPQRMQFAFTSCQHYETGYFNGYPHMIQEDLDLIIHLGDYIYEYAGVDNRVRKHLGKEIESLANYRQRYAQYRLDESLMDAHRLFPWLVTWDDHEFDNNYADLISEEEGISPEAFLTRRMNAYQAYYEFMPLRRSAFPQGPHMTLYRKCQYGRLANFFVLDTRQYRTDQPNGDGEKPKTGKVLDQNGTILGANQEHWLMSGLTRSETTWNVLAQQVMMADLNRGDEKGARYSMDQWPGYEISRRRLLKFFHERNIPNPIVLTGDIHVNWVNDLMLDSDQKDSPLVGTEFVGSSMSSSGNGGNYIAEYERAAAQNDFVKWYNSNRGYVTCDLRPDSWTSHFRVTPFVDKPNSPLIKKASFVVQAGRPGAEIA